MFTGIVSSIGTVRSAERRGDLRLVIACDLDLATVDLGASIACSGVCLTVVDKGPDWFAVDVSDESIARTASGLGQTGSRLNLERALRIGDELGGHFVTGHVDGVGTVVSVTERGGSLEVVIAASANLAPMVAPKGSVTLDGVSLTVNTVEDHSDGVRFSVNLIPHTAENTSFKDIQVDRAVNIEIDVLARYLHRMRTTM